LISLVKNPNRTKKKVQRDVSRLASLNGNIALIGAKQLNFVEFLLSDGGQVALSQSSMRWPKSFNDRISKKDLFSV
jgi:hypothetical protein